MNEEKPHFHVSHDYDIVPPMKEQAYPVLVSDWTYLKKKIRRIESGGLMFHTVGSIFLGVSGSALLTVLTLAKEVAQNNRSASIICWSIFIASLITGLLSLFFAHKERNVTACSKEDILEEMNRLEQRYPKQ